MSQMPKINYEPQTEEEETILSLILNKGHLRASKPSVPRLTGVMGIDDLRHLIHVTREGALKGEAAYVWRMVAFMVSPKNQHHCMPMTADFGISGNFATRNDKAKELDKLVDRIVNCVPKEKWYGAHRWGRAFYG